MNKAVGISIVLVATFLSAQTIHFDRGGAGFRAGLVIPDDPVDIGFNIGGHGDIAFKIGRAGEIHYNPSLDIWFGSEDDFNQNALPPNDDYFALEVALNLFDGSYYFPLPGKVLPFVGLGPMIAIDYHKIEYHSLVNDYSQDDTDANVGFNFFTGVDFAIQPNFLLFTEIRGKLGDWDAFKLLGGMTFIFGR
jgi:hypothetical protein